MGLHHSHPIDGADEAKIAYLIQQATYRDLMLPRLRGDFNVRYNDPHTVYNPIQYDDLDIGRMLGEGAYGVVHFVTHRRTKQQYALKIMIKSKVVKMKQVEHALNEKKIQRATTFPFLVPAFSSFKDAYHLYVVMPYLSGGDLFDCIHALGKLNEEQAKFYAAQLILAFEYMHYLDLVYRDLKPENIMISSNGYLKLTDFGFVKYIGRFARTWTMCGTPEYLPPEIILCQGSGKAGDWWSFGVLMYEMCTGNTPFANDAPVKMYENITHGRYQMPKHLSHEMQDIIRNLLQVDVTKRYGTLYDGVGDIKLHAFFVNTDWSGIYYQHIMPTFIVPARREDFNTKPPVTMSHPATMSQPAKPSVSMTFDKNEYEEEFSEF